MTFYVESDTVIGHCFHLLKEPANRMDGHGYMLLDDFHEYTNETGWKDAHLTYGEAVAQAVHNGGNNDIRFDRYYEKSSPWRRLEIESMKIPPCSVCAVEPRFRLVEVVEDGKRFHKLVTV